jgi:hypothetical protein
VKGEKGRWRKGRWRKGRRRNEKMEDLNNKKLNFLNTVILCKQPTTKQ